MAGVGARGCKRKRRGLMRGSDEHGRTDPAGSTAVRGADARREPGALGASAEHGWNGCLGVGRSGCGVGGCAVGWPYLAVAVRLAEPETRSLPPPTAPRSAGAGCTAPETDQECLQRHGLRSVRRAGPDEGATGPVRAPESRSTAGYLNLTTPNRACVVHLPTCRHGQLAAFARDPRRDATSGGGGEPGGDASRGDAGTRGGGRGGGD